MYLAVKINWLLLFFLPFNAFALGNLFIIGGGAQSDALVQEYLDLCGRDKKMLVVAKASGYEEEVLRETIERFTTLGATQLNGYRCDGDANSCSEQLAQVECVYFSGGDQKRLVDHFANTSVMEQLKKIYQNGGTVAGTSAGAAIMSDVMLTGNIVDGAQSFNRIAKDHVESAAGFGFLSGFVVDQHFVKRQRQNRLISKVLENPELVGIGIDESTAVVFKNSTRRFEVVGAASVMVYDARTAQQLHVDEQKNFNAVNIKLSILTSGGSFALD